MHLALLLSSIYYNFLSLKSLFGDMSSSIPENIHLPFHINFSFFSVAIKEKKKQEKIDPYLRKPKYAKHCEQWQENKIFKWENGYAWRRRCHQHFQLPAIAQLHAPVSRPKALQSLPQD